MLETNKLSQFYVKFTYEKFRKIHINIKDKRINMYEFHNIEQNGKSINIDYFNFLSYYVLSVIRYGSVWIHFHRKN